MRLNSAVAVALALALAPGLARAQGVPTIPWWNTDGATTVGSTGGTYRLSGTTGQPDAAVSTGGVYRLSGGFWVTASSGIVAVEPIETLPTEFAMRPPSPNPFTGSTLIAMALPLAGPVRIEVFGINGGRVRLLADESRPAGVHRFAWDGRDDAGRPVPSGIYFVRARAHARDLTQRLVRLD